MLRLGGRDEGFAAPDSLSRPPRKLRKSMFGKRGRLLVSHSSLFSPKTAPAICNRPRNGGRKMRREILIQLGKSCIPTQELPPMKRIRFIPAQVKTFPDE